LTKWKTGIIRLFAAFVRLVSAVASPALLFNIGAYRYGIFPPSWIEASLVVHAVISIRLLLLGSDGDDLAQMGWAWERCGERRND
jgi:hypothetical protein